jgi:hypothetical protein
MNAGGPARRRDGIVAHLVDVAIAILLIGALCTWYVHYYAPFANPAGPIRWQNLAIVAGIFWADLRLIGRLPENPAYLIHVAVPFVLIGLFVGVVYSPLWRWLRIVLHTVVCFAFVVATVFLSALVRVPGYL